MIPSRVHKRAVEILRERRQQASEQMQDTTVAPIEERNTAYDALIESPNFEQDYALFEQQYPGEFAKIAERRRRQAFGSA